MKPACAGENCFASLPSYRHHRVDIWIMNTYTTAEAAAEMSANINTIRRICSTQDIGTLRGSTRLLDESDMTRLRESYRGRVGNPRMVAGNYFAGAKSRKTSKKSGKRTIPKKSK